ncbi:MAG: hypothetical protein ACO3QC_12155, partial [Phycisphaerales bacterium]
FFDCLEPKDVQDWSKDLVLHNLRIVSDLNDCWLHEVSWAVDLLSACQNSAALSLDCLVAPAEATRLAVPAATATP